MECPNCLRNSERSIAVVHNGVRSRFEGRRNGELVAVVDFSLRGDSMVITHTWTDPAWRGQGVASGMSEKVLEYARAASLRVVPVCGFMAQFICDHPEYVDLLAPPE